LHAFHFFAFFLQERIDKGKISSRRIEKGKISSKRFEGRKNRAQEEKIKSRYECGVGVGLVEVVLGVGWCALMDWWVGGLVGKLKKSQGDGFSKRLGGRQDVLPVW
tara:strand:- start:70 stop:387 length:318 start_codon:yes stop_codon:yes gene_type:complete